MSAVQAKSNCTSGENLSTRSRQLQREAQLRYGIASAVNSPTNSPAHTMSGTTRFGKSTTSGSASGELFDLRMASFLLSYFKSENIDISVQQQQTHKTALMYAFERHGLRGLRFLLYENAGASRERKRIWAHSKVIGRRDVYETFDSAGRNLFMMALAALGCRRCR